MGEPGGVGVPDPPSPHCSPLLCAGFPAGKGRAGAAALEGKEEARRAGGHSGVECGRRSPGAVGVIYCIFFFYFLGKEGCRVPPANTNPPPDPISRPQDLLFLSPDHSWGGGGEDPNFSLTPSRSSLLLQLSVYIPAVSFCCST